MSQQNSDCREATAVFSPPEFWTGEGFCYTVNGEAVRPPDDDLPKPDHIV